MLISDTTWAAGPDIAGRYVEQIGAVALERWKTSRPEDRNLVANIETIAATAPHTFTALALNLEASWDDEDDRLDFLLTIKACVRYQQRPTPDSSCLFACIYHASSSVLTDTELWEMLAALLDVPAAQTATWVSLAGNWNAEPGELTAATGRLILR